MKQALFSVAFMILSMVTYAQSTLTGTVIDAGTKDPLPGASVVVNGTLNGTVTDFDGNFSLTVKEDKGELKVSFIGYIEQQITYDAANSTDLGAISVAENSVGLDEIKVVSSFGRDRETPVAISNIAPEAIETKLGTQEFPEVMKSTPGVYATKQGGGFGDSRISLRGFGSDVTAVMINGVPVNDMENGKVYWSNWAGLSDVTKAMQVQRGMGASKLAVPSAGGTINILTRTADAAKGGSVYAGLGHDGYMKQAFTASTGMTDNGWAVTLSGAHTSGNGYADGTAFEGWSYFANVSKTINEDHTLAFSAFGATQTHNNRSTKLTMETWNEKGRRHSSDWGYMNGEVMGSKINSYSKPQLSLNHYWTINNQLTLSNVVYASFGRGGGQSGYSASADGSYYWGDDRIGDSNSLIDFDSIYRSNMENGESDKVMAESINSHNWYGGLSTLNWDMTDNWDIVGGVDLRYYQGQHRQELGNLLGGNYAVINVEEYGNGGKEKVVYEGDVIGYNNDGEVAWESLFGQAEYSEGDVAAFANLAVSNVGYRRTDFEQYTKGEHQTDWVNFQTFSIKGGANYNLDSQNNIFVNAGYFQRPPMMNSVFLNYGNNINNEAKNESIYSFELGYGFRGERFAANANAYYTKWMDKSMVKTIYPDENNGLKENMYANIDGLDAVHMGFEADFTYRASDKLQVTGMASVADWRWANDVNSAFFNEAQELIYESKLYTKDLKVGNAAQITAALGVKYEAIQDLNFTADYNFAGKNYSDFDPTSRTDEAQAGVQAWELPTFGLVDLGMTYNFDFGGVTATAFGNINNLFDTTYVSDATDGGSASEAGNAYNSTMYMGVGRTWSFGMKFKF